MTPKRTPTSSHLFHLDDPRQQLITSWTLHDINEGGNRIPPGGTPI